MFRSRRGYSLFCYNVVADPITDLAHPDHPALIVQLSPNARLAETRDGSYVDITISNYLPCVSIYASMTYFSNIFWKMFPADNIIVIVAGPGSTKFTYSSPIPNGCPPGKSGLTLFCPVGCARYILYDHMSIFRQTYSAGLFVLESSEIRSSHLLLQSNYWKSPNKGQALKPSLLRVPRDLLALDVRISQSNRSMLFN